MLLRRACADDTENKKGVDMKILINNGNPDPSNVGFETYLDQLEAALIRQGHSVTRLNLRDMDLRGCNGCFGCWTRSPGECVQADDGPKLRQAVIQSDFHLLASPLKMGFVSALSKTSLDKSLPLIHPYIAVDHGEAHHRARYARYPQIGLLLQEEPDTDAADRHIIEDIFSRAALNMKAKLVFRGTTMMPVEEVAAAITSPALQNRLPFDEKLGPILGQNITPPTRLTIFNGSPRGKKGNTPLLLGHFARGFETHPGNSTEVFHLNRILDREIFRAAFEQAECVWLGFPLYVDSMPGQVKAFIESLEGLAGRANNPPVGFLVQSGFPEALHSRHVERYLQKLASRLGSTYLGTIVKGGAEGIQIMPEKMTAPVYTNLYEIGRQFGETGRLDAALLKAVAGLERFPAYLGPVFRLLSHTPLLNGYWDQDLKKNGVFDQRFARPYAQ